MRDIQQRHAPTWFEHPHNLPHSRVTLGPPVDIVQHQAGHDHIEGAVGERDLPRVRIFDIDPISDAFSARVRPGCLGAIPRLIDTMPDINADCRAGRQAFRGCDEQQAAPTTNIKNHLIAPPRKSTDQGVARGACRPCCSRACRRPQPGKVHPQRADRRPRRGRQCHSRPGFALAGVLSCGWLVSIASQRYAGAGICDRLAEALWFIGSNAQLLPVRQGQLDRCQP